MPRRAPSDFVMVAIMGAAAIEPALAAIRRGVVVALANKECVVAAGAVFHDAMEASGAQVLPVDSEHNAIFQVLGSGDASEAELVTITASGGPFREWSLERMRAATVEAGGGPSQLGDGPQDFARQRHPDEQGPGADRGAFPVRPAAGKAGGGGASAVHRPLPGLL